MTISIKAWSSCWFLVPVFSTGRWAKIAVKRLDILLDLSSGAYLETKQYFPAKHEWTLSFSNINGSSVVEQMDKYYYTRDQFCCFWEFRTPRILQMWSLLCLVTLNADLPKVSVSDLHLKSDKEGFFFLLIFPFHLLVCCRIYKLEDTCAHWEVFWHCTSTNLSRFVFLF